MPIKHYVQPLALAEVYPQVMEGGLWTNDQQERYDTFSQEMMPSKLAQIATEGLRVESTGERNFRMVVDMPYDWDGSAIFGSNEFAKGMREPGKLGGTTYALRRLLAARAIANPNAAVIMLPNSTPLSNSLNFSSKEISAMRNGSRSPMLDRMKIATESADDITVVGVSQAAMFGTAFAAEGDQPVSSLVASTPPNTKESTRLELIKSSFQSGNELMRNYRASGLPEENIIEEAMGLSGYVSGAVLRPRMSLALLSLMACNDFGNDIEVALQRGVVAEHIWGQRDYVSPDHANEEVQQHLQGYNNYTGTSYPTDHSLNDSHSVVAAHTARARRAVLNNP